MPGAERSQIAGNRRLGPRRLLSVVVCLLGLAAGAPAANAAPHWTEIDSLPEQILDVEADRVLYMPTTGTNATLAVKDRHTDDVTPIPLGDGMNPWGAFLTPYGAVIATSEPPNVGALYEWRPGSLTRLGALTGLQLKATGSYVLWGARDSTFGPLNLFRRDLDTGTTIQLASDGASGGQHDAYDDWAGSDLAANGDVAMWRSDGIYRYRAGVTEQVGQSPDPDNDAHVRFARTDGTNVVWSTWAYAERGSIRGHGPAGGFTLDEFTTSSAFKEPAPDYDYRVNGGWTAFTRGAEPAETVWTRNPSGVETAVSPAGGYEIAGLSSTGEVIYGTYDDGNNNQTSYLARPGEDPVEVGRTWDNQRSGRGFSNHVFKSGDHWYSIAFGSLRRLQLTDAPVDGSQTTIDSGPQGVESDASATFEFSSTVPGATFECRLDGAAWETCSSPRSYASLAEGQHTFLVRSVAPGGAVDPEPASQTWTIALDHDPPDPFSLLGPAHEAKTTDPTPTLSWQAANDAGSGVDHYSVWIDGGHVADVGTTEFTPGAALPDGPHVWRVDAVDANGNVRGSGERTFVIDTTAPSAALRASPNPVLTDDPVALDAAGTSDPNGGTVVRYEWDLDGDGAFERDTGATPNTSTSYPTRREIQPAVRVTDDVGHTATASTALSVRQEPPAGRVGVSINDAARFTNDVDVTVRVVWPALATDVALSNDGGFGDARVLPVDEEIDWTLDPSGSGRFPRTIYARFEGIAGRETYQDDIILDQTRPRVITAELVARRSAPRAGAKRTYLLRIRGRDAISGVERMQVTTNRNRPGAARRYRSRVTFKARTSRIYVRVQDGAGNWSRWKRVGR